MSPCSPTSELESTLKRAIESDAPTLVEVPTARDAAGPWVSGWWSFPTPGQIDDERQIEYKKAEPKCNTCDSERAALC